MTFVLPNAAESPVGGYKVHYEYASQLAARGHRVSILHPYRAAWNRRHFWRRYLVRSIARHLGRIELVSWFVMHRRVRVREVPYLHRLFLPRADVTVLTGWQTSEAIRRGTPWSGPLVQVVYDVELFSTGDELERRRIAAALSRRRIAKISTSDAVTAMLSQFGVAPIATIPCGLDFETWRLDTPPDERGRVVGFPLRQRPDKGARQALEVASLLYRRDRSIRFVAFGDGRDLRWPSFVDHRGVISDDELRDLYNSCAVFFLPSRSEGWGLPAAEAASCGAAVVSFANGGVESFLSDRESGRIVPVGDCDAMAEAIWELLEDQQDRERLVAAARKSVAQMSWSAATQRIALILRQQATGRRGNVRSGA